MSIRCTRLSCSSIVLNKSPTFNYCTCRYLAILRGWVGEIPYGYHFEAKSYAESTHGLPLPPNDLGESNHRITYMNILKFLLGDKITVTECNNGQPSTSNVLNISIARDSKMPRIFTKTDQMEMVKSSLDYLCSVVNDDGATISGGALLTLYSIEYLLFSMKKASSIEANIEPPKNIHITNLYFGNDIYEYQRNIACDVSLYIVEILPPSPLI